MGKLKVNELEMNKIARRIQLGWVFNILTLGVFYYTTYDYFFGLRETMQMMKLWNVGTHEWCITHKTYHLMHPNTKRLECEGWLVYLHTKDESISIYEKTYSGGDQDLIKVKTNKHTPHHKLYLKLLNIHENLIDGNIPKIV